MQQSTIFLLLARYVPNVANSSMRSMIPRADNGSVGHGSNGSTNVNRSRGSRVSIVKHLTYD